MDVKFFKETYGQLPPKMIVESFPSVQTVSGETVSVLGKITVPLQLSDREFLCVFYLMENLAYDAILGGDFLRQNKALIDLEISRITFKQLGNCPSRTSEEIEPAHVMGTFLLQTTKYKDKKTSSKIDPKPPPQISDSSSVFRSQKKKEIGQIEVNQTILVLLLVLLYLLTASRTHMPVMSVINKPVAQTTHKVCVHQDGGTDSVHSGTRFQISPANHKEPYKIELNENESQTPRLSLKPSTKAIEVDQESVHAVSESSVVGVPQELHSIADWSSEKPLSVAQKLPKKGIQIKPSPLLN